MQRVFARAGVVVLAGACGGGGGGQIDSPPAGDGLPSDDAPPGSFAMSSPMLASGAAFDPANTCDGADTSPQLAWANPPGGTRSFAVVLTDQTISLVHWVIYDVPAASTGLPANVDKTYAPTNVAGAHQTESYQAQTHGYLGPCPPSLHTYQFAAFALDVDILPGTSMSTTRAQAVPLIMQHELATATLTGTYQH
jgi:Raf kinase inhibitor-like YbhB/YbcL family protein